MRAYTFTNHPDIPVICYVCYIADVACMALVPHRTVLPTLPQLTSLLQILPLSCVMLRHGQWSLSPALYCVLFCFGMLCSSRFRSLHRSNILHSNVFFLEMFGCKCLLLCIQIYNLHSKLL